MIGMLLCRIGMLLCRIGMHARPPVLESAACPWPNVFKCARCGAHFIDYGPAH